MHEMTVTQGIMDIVLKTARDNNASKVKAVNLTVGTLAQVVPDCVAFYFEILTKDTVVEGAVLNIKTVQARAKCSGCGHEFEADDMLLKCPQCGDVLGKLISGRELAVTSIDIDKPANSRERRAKSKNKNKNQ